MRTTICLLLLLAVAGVSCRKPARPEPPPPPQNTEQDSEISYNIKKAQELYDTAGDLYTKSFFSDAEKKLTTAGNLLEMCGRNMGKLYKKIGKLRKRCHVFALLTDGVQPNELSDGQGIVVFKHRNYGEILGRVAEKTETHYTFETRIGKKVFPVGEILSVKKLTPEEFSNEITNELYSNISTAVKNKNPIMIYTQGVFFAKRHRLYDQVTSLLEKAFHQDNWDFIISIFLAGHKPAKLVADVYYSWNGKIPRPLALGESGGPIVAEADERAGALPPPEEMEDEPYEEQPAVDDDERFRRDEEPSRVTDRDLESGDSSFRRVEGLKRRQDEEDEEGDEDEWDRGIDDNVRESASRGRIPTRPSSGGGSYGDAEALMEIGTVAYRDSMARGVGDEAEEARIRRNLKIARRNLVDAKKIFERLKSSGRHSEIESRIIQINQMISDIIQRWPIDLDWQS